MLVALMATACVISSCKRAARPPRTDIESEKPKRLRAVGLLALTYQLPGKERIGCQVHLLKEGSGRRYAVDLGSTKRRRFYPKSDSYWSRPATFTYKDPISRLGFLWWSAGMKKPKSVFGSGAPKAPPVHHELSIPAGKFAFSCVALSGEQGSSIEGVVDEGTPTVTARRMLRAKQLTASALRPVLESLVGM